MDQVRTHSFGYLRETIAHRTHQRDLAKQWPSADPLGFPQRSIEVQPVDVFFGCTRRRVLRPGEVKSLPSEASLLSQDRTRAECVAAVQRDRVIQDVEHA